MEVHFGPWAGTPEYPLRAENFRQFRLELASLYDCLDGTASFGSSTDDLLHLQLVGDGSGHIRATCSIGEDGELFTCEMKLDQTFVPSILAGLERIETEFKKPFSWF